ncbi:hypothetical protein [Pedobacter caeni]|uniref:Uncharacterized protein n=1 Tax=Pedobacter caeni TaxID=288992 RepID=A0A1M4U609_9SPHI|nr:hypothetical protein [Pedobacter caeni]SHE52115.1 hypothetical protein SAMN04488522_101442 [Pedobacter caeni]
MKEQNDKNKQLEFRKVYLSDMRSVINMYQKTNQDSSTHDQTKKDKTIRLTTDFGLPLSVASKENEVVGFAAVHINASGELIWDSSADDLNIEHQLIEQAKITLYDTFENVQKDHSKLKISIEKLVDWLNTCQ